MVVLSRACTQHVIQIFLSPRPISLTKQQATQCGQCEFRLYIFATNKYREPSSTNLYGENSGLEKPKLDVHEVKHMVLDMLKQFKEKYEKSSLLYG
jgi:hypothetical protein